MSLFCAGWWLRRKRFDIESLGAGKFNLGNVSLFFVSQLGTSSISQLIPNLHKNNLCIRIKLMQNSRIKIYIHVQPRPWSLWLFTHVPPTLTCTYKLTHTNKQTQHTVWGGKGYFRDVFWKDMKNHFYWMIVPHINSIHHYLSPAYYSHMLHAHLVKSLYTMRCGTLYGCQKLIVWKWFKIKYWT